MGERMPPEPTLPARLPPRRAGAPDPRRAPPGAFDAGPRRAPARARWGIALDVRRPRFGDPLPETMAEHAGAVIFGGPMSANDPDPWIRAEIDWTAVPLREGAPLLGLCLGAQMIARQLGQPVGPHADGHVEIGYYPISPTAAGDALVGQPFPRWVYHWHGEGFSLPAGAEALADGTDFACQAFRYGRGAVGLQFHPEVTYAMMSRWIVLGHEKASAKNARPVHQHRPDWFLHDAPVARWAESFLAAWAAGALPEPRVAPATAGPSCPVPARRPPLVAAM